MLPTKLSSADVKGWARAKTRSVGRNAVKAAQGGSKLSQRLAATKGAPSPPPFGKSVDDDDEDEDQDAKAAPGKKAPPFGKKAKSGPNDKKGPQPEDDEDEDPKGLKPGKAKEPAEDPEANKQKPPTTKKLGVGQRADGKDQKGDKAPVAAKPGDKAKAAVPGKAPAPGQPPQKGAAPGQPPAKGAAPDKGAMPGQPKPAAQLPNTEPKDPVNAGAPDLPEELLNDDGDDADVDDLPEADPILAEVEEKLGDFAETLEDRADEIEELAGEVQGDLTGDDVDIDTKREVQQLIPDDLRQDLVEHLSGMSDEEINAFCQHLLEIGRVEDPDLVAGFLRAAASDSTDDEDGDEEDDDQDEKNDDGGESEVESDEDE